MKNKILLLLALMTAFVSIKANDGVYFTSGNFLVPLQESDISVDKEVLTITIGKDGFANVDVQYVFVNSGQEKRVTMAFEASAPYNDLSPISHKGVHPYIKDFTVNMNDCNLAYRNAVVACRNMDGGHMTDFTPLNLNKWKGYGEVPDEILPESNSVYNAELDSVVSFAYAYYFDATFKPGKNIVHHTYKYRMSYNVAQKFTIPYWLTPAARWANRQVDDFTLRITADSANEFCLVDSIFSQAPFRSAKGNKVFRIKEEYGENEIFAQITPGDTVVWHAKGFKPKADMCIESPKWLANGRMNRWTTEAYVVVAPDGHEYPYLADCGNSYFVAAPEYMTVPKGSYKLLKYEAKKGKGWITVDAETASKVNIRRKPTTKSAVAGTIDADGKEYKCLGLVRKLNGKEGDWEWFKVNVDGKVGYISQQLMLWNAIKRNNEK